MNLSITYYDWLKNIVENSNIKEIWVDPEIYSRIYLYLKREFKDKIIVHNTNEIGLDNPFHYCRRLSYFVNSDQEKIAKLLKCDLEELREFIYKEKHD